MTSRSPHSPGRAQPVVAVFGAASLVEQDSPYRTAFALGAEIARRGWILASGGYGGTMEAASRGAAEAGGHTIGVSCETMSRSGRRLNPWVKEEIRCSTARERLLTLVRMEDAAVALEGGIGTLTEISFCAMQIQTGELTPRPLLLMGAVWEETFRAFFHSAIPFQKETDRSLFTFVSSPVKAAEIIQDHFEKPGGSGG